MNGAMTLPGRIRDTNKDLAEYFDAVDREIAEALAAADLKRDDRNYWSVHLNTALRDQGAESRRSVSIPESRGSTGASKRKKTGKHLKPLVLACLIGLAMGAPCGAEPWIVIGQTQLAIGQQIINPTPNQAGLVGEVTTLPYMVPTGYRLTITGFGIESYDVAGTSNIFLVFGDPTPGTQATAAFLNSHASFSVNSSRSSHETVCCAYVVPAGTRVHVFVTNGSAVSGVYGWVVSGHLDPAP